MLRLKNQLCFKAYTVSRHIISIYRVHLNTMNLTYPQYLVMLALWEYNTLNIKKLGKLLLLDTGTLTPLLKRMETKDLIERVRSSDDERVVIIKLTNKGIELKKQAKLVPKQIRKCIDITDDEYWEFMRISDLIMSIE